MVARIAGTADALSRSLVIGRGPGIIVIPVARVALIIGRTWYLLAGHAIKPKMT
jgi:hypothetical protein